MSGKTTVSTAIAESHVRENINVYPVRIQRKRTRGFNLQKYSRSVNGLDAVIIDRTTGWGNKWKIGDPHPNYPHQNYPMDRFDVIALHEKEVRNNVAHSGIDWLLPLKGKNLACTCKEGESCHGDIYIELANDMGKDND